MSQVTSGQQTAAAMRYWQGDLAILSAETYHDPDLALLTSPRSATGKKTRLQGNTTQDGTRKRGLKRHSPEGGDQDDEEKKRSRGRPRLDIKDETAADRRRTQIRLAQRAYRNRKENAIQTLERRVQELKDTNEEMSNAFMRLHDFAVNNGLVDQAPEFGRQLRSTTEKFLTLARLSSEDSGKLEDGEGSPKHDYSESHQDKDSSKPSETPNKSPQQTSLTLNTSKPNQLYGGFIVTHEPSHEDLLADFTNTINSLPPTTSSQDYEIITQPTLDNASFPFDITPDFNFNTFTSSPFPNLSTPTTYTAHEATFGRRLQRTGIERGLVLITMPNPPAKRFNRVFGFCLMLESKEAIYKRLLRGAQRTMHESLHNWYFPFFTLGGQGTHLNASEITSQRIGNQGTVDVMKPNSTNGGFNMGPFNPEVTDVYDKMLDKDMRISFSGFTGEFFDCDEVELYLHQRGVVIPPAADFITAEIDASLFQNETQQANYGSNSPSNFTFPMDGAAAAVGMTGNRSKSPLSSISSGETLAVSSPEDSSSTVWARGVVDPMLTRTPSSGTPIEFGMGIGLAEGAFPTPPLPANTRKMVTVDVNLLVYELIERTVCLGRSPGIKQEDINTAFWKASQVIG